MRIEIYSRDKLENLSKNPFSPNTSLISIYDTDDTPAILINQPAHRINLQFDDVYINELDDSDYSDFHFKLFDSDYAKKIVDFVYKYKDETNLLICQCEYGESRSAAVAAAILEHFYGNGISIYSDERYCPNSFIYNILNKEFERKKPHAWMIRNDGKEISCLQHIYANKNDVYETLYAGEWLYNNTRYDNVKLDVLSLINAYGKTLTDKDFIKAILNDIDKKPYVFLTKEFVLTHQKEILENENSNSIEFFMARVEEELNNEFMRTRLGGMYNTVDNSKDLYFRISNEKFDWSDIIKHFIDNHKKNIETVTVVYDEESTGKSDLYKFKDGKIFNKTKI